MKLHFVFDGPFGDFCSLMDDDKPIGLGPQERIFQAVEYTHTVLSMILEIDLELPYEGQNRQKDKLNIVEDETEQERKV